jgi:hypothetical protein
MSIFKEITMDKLSNTPSQDVNKRDPQYDDKKKGQSPVDKVVKDTQDKVERTLYKK